MSLDGVFDADPVYFDKWWVPFDSPSRQKYIQETINNCDIMLYGRTTYEMLYPYWSALTNNEHGVADKLNKGKKYVVSSKLKKAPWDNTSIINDNLIAEVEKIKNEDGGYILVQGSSSLLKPLLEAGLVDEVRLLITPVIVGSGKRPFFEYINVQMEFSGTQQLDKNLVLLTYHAK